MTAAPSSRRPPRSEPTWVDDQGRRWYCGYCAGWATVRCPDCAGFAGGCRTCVDTGKVACIFCSGGRWPKWIP